jgi:fatty acid-binding protein DegV
LACLIDLVREFPRIDQIAILSIGQPGDVEHLTDALSDICEPSRIVVSEFSPVLTSHRGPGAMGIVVYEGEGLEKRS